MSLESTQVSPSAGKGIPSTWFVAEIQQMMYGFGDCRKPSAESATLIEGIVHQQMTQMLHQAAEVAAKRNARFIGIEDFLFLMRRDKSKLRRLLRYLSLKDNKMAILSGQDEDEAGGQGEPKVQPLKKRRKICSDFLTAIDQTGELANLIDDTEIDMVKQERLLRAEMQSSQMDATQYLEYTEAKQTSFGRKYKSQKFKDWLMMGINLEIKPNPLAMEVVCYLAYETVAQIVDLTFLVKRDRLAQADDPFVAVMPPVCQNHEMLTTIKTSPGRSQDMLTSPQSRSSSPIMSPPSTPSTPTAQPAASQVTSGTASGTSSKIKSKKSKRGGSSHTLYQQPISTSIQPTDIREALRRWDQAIGPLARSNIFIPKSPRLNMLCM